MLTKRFLFQLVAEKMGETSLKKIRVFILISLVAIFMCGCQANRNISPAGSDISPTDTAVTPIPTVVSTTPTSVPPTPTLIPSVSFSITDGPEWFRQTYEQEHIDGLPIYSAVEPAKLTIYIKDTLELGETVFVRNRVEPENAYCGFTYVSSDESILAVDKYGRVTGVGEGVAQITAKTYNGVSSSYRVSVLPEASDLTFELTADGSGYAITGANKDAYIVTIPAYHNGLPVKEITGRAFIDCEKLWQFRVDPQQKDFYTVDGVLFTDSPEKTLVRMPNCYLDHLKDENMYTPPLDTVVIGDYAFAGFGGSYHDKYITLPEGITTLGDYVFTEIRDQVRVYTPKSLTNIGSNILAGQLSNVPFCVKEDSAAKRYAQTYHIPYGTVYEAEQRVQTVETIKPACSTAANYKVPDLDDICFVKGTDVIQGTSYSMEYGYIERQIDLKPFEGKEYPEIRVLLEYSWRGFIPDKQGTVPYDYPAMTGIYGMGHTDAEATLIGYDITGKALWTKEVQGDFAFAFDGAVNLGVAGGKRTTMYVVPYEPTFVASSGSLVLDPEKWLANDFGHGTRYIFATFQNASFSQLCPDFLGSLGYSSYDSTGIGMDTSDHFMVRKYEFTCNSALSQTGCASIELDGISTLYKDGCIEIKAIESYGLDKEYGQAVAEIYDTVKKTMVGTYFPDDVPLRRITVSLNGGYPSAWDSTINMSLYNNNVKSSQSTYAHEMVHAIDQTLPYYVWAVPATWLEGRAEYIEDIVDRELGGSGKKYPDGYDWDFLTEADCEDFFSFFCFNTNRQNRYAIGYYFIKYLSETYGEDITAKITRDLAALQFTRDDYLNMTEQEQAELFGDAVKKETCDTVFQDFVMRVIG